MGGIFPRYSPPSEILIQKPVIKFPSNSPVLTRHLLILFLCFLCPRDIISAMDLHQSKDSVLLIHPSSVINQTKREESLLLPRQIAELMMSATSSSSSLYGLRARVRSIFDSDTIASGRVQHKINRIVKSIPQILPLPPRSMKNATDDSEARLISLYLLFITDICKEKAWSVIRILIDGERSPELCGYLQDKLFRKESAIHTGYCGEASGDILSSNDDKQMGKGDLPQSNARLTVPIFSFYFIRSKNKTGTGRVAFHPKLLMNYLPFKPVFVLSGGENRDIIIDGVQPESPANFKWTLVYPASNSSWNGSSQSSQSSSLEELYLEDIYGLASSSEPLTQLFGSWSRKGGLEIDPDNALGLSDFRGRTIRITTVAAPPFVYIVKSSSGKVSCKGYLPDVLDVLSVQLNFTFEMMTPSDKQFGNVYPNGSWSGMVGMLEKKEADIAMTSFSLTSQRKMVMDFSPPVEYSSVRLLIRRDWQNQEIKWSAYLQPLDTKVWVAIPISICLGVITLAVFARTKILEITPVNSFILLSSCFVLQGQNEHSTIKVTPYRLVLGTFWLLAVFLFACYTARLTSFLAATTENLPVKSLAQAIQSKNWKVGLTKGSAFIDRIRVRNEYLGLTQESRVDVLKSLSHRLSEDSSGLVGSFQEGMDKVFKERYVFFTSELVPSFLIKGNCSYTWLPDRYFSGFGYMGYQKYLPHSAVISQKIAEIRETGQMQRLFLKWWGRDSICNLATTGDSFLGMSLYETGTAFLILILGITFSLTLLAAECLKTPGTISPLSKCFSNNAVVDIHSVNNHSTTITEARKLEILNPSFASYNYETQYAMFLKR